MSAPVKSMFNMPYGSVVNTERCAIFPPSGWIFMPKPRFNIDTGEVALGIPSEPVWSSAYDLTRKA